MAAAAGSVKPAAEVRRDFAAQAGAPESPVRAASAEAPARPNPQVGQRSVRRKFSIAERCRIVDEADACTEVGQIGALCRREGLNSSTLCGFRKQKAVGKLDASPEKAAKAREQHLASDASRQRDSRKIASLEAENKKLKVLIELQKKVAELVDLSFEVPSTGEIHE